MLIICLIVSFYEARVALMKQLGLIIELCFLYLQRKGKEAVECSNKYIQRQ